MTREVKIESLVALERTGVDVQFLGSLLWFTIADLRVTREELAVAILDAGIDQKHLPRPISPRDAFRRATKRVELKEHPLGDGRFLNLLVRDVAQDREKIVRYVVREIRDKQNVRLQFLPVVDLRLFDDDPGATLAIIPLTDLMDDERQAVERFRRDFEVEKMSYNGCTVRDIIMDVLQDCDPVKVRPSGGVYFTPEEHREKIEALKQLVGGLTKYNTNGHKSTLWSIPVINAEEQKEMLQESLEDQVRTDSESLVVEMLDLIEGGKRKITPALAQQYIERVQRLGNLVSKYEEMLQVQTVSAKANYELAMGQAIALLSKVAAA
jgi:hypothetical protein